VLILRWLQAPTVFTWAVMICLLQLHAGCWVKKVVKNDAGAAYLKDPE